MQRVLTIFLVLAISTSAGPTLTWAAEPAISGTVTDSLGAVISGATVTLLEGGKTIDSATTNTLGKFQFKIKHAGRYSVRVEAKTFAASTTQEVFAEPGRGWDTSLILAFTGCTKHCRHGHGAGDSGSADGNVDQCHRPHRLNYPRRFASRVARSTRRAGGTDWANGRDFGNVGSRRA